MGRIENMLHFTSAFFTERECNAILFSYTPRKLPKIWIFPAFSVKNGAYTKNVFSHVPFEAKCGAYIKKVESYIPNLMFEVLPGTLEVMSSSLEYTSSTLILQKEKAKDIIVICIGTTKGVEGKICL